MLKIDNTHSSEQFLKRKRMLNSQANNSSTLHTNNQQTNGFKKNTENNNTISHESVKNGFNGGGITKSNKGNIVDKLYKSFSNNALNQSTELLPRKIEYELSYIIQGGEIVNKNPKKKKTISSILETISTDNNTNDSNFINKTEQHTNKLSQIFQKNLIPNIPSIGKGLRNVGNTCFLNSTLQGLIYSEYLNNYFYLFKHSESCKVSATSVCMLCQYEKLITQALSISFSSKNNNSNLISANSSFTPMSIIQNIKVISKFLKVGRQEDAHEFLVKLLEAMEDSSKKDLKLRANTFISNSIDIDKENVIKKLFGGVYSSTVTCGTCKNISSIKGDYMSLSLVSYYKCLFLKSYYLIIYY